VNYFQVDRHLSGEAHKIAFELEARNGEAPNIEGQIYKRSAVTIQSAINSSAREGYKKLLRTAWNLACTPSMPHSHFNVLVKCQRENGIRLIDGKDNHKAGKNRAIFYNLFSYRVTHI